METHRRPESLRNPSRRASYPTERRDVLDQVFDEFPERPSSRGVRYSALEDLEYRGHSSLSLPSYYTDDIGRNSGYHSTPGNGTPRRHRRTDSGANKAAKCKKPRGTAKSPRHIKRPRFKKIVSSWTEILTTISEDPTMEEEEEEDSEDASSLSSRQRSLTTSMLSYRSFGVTDLVQAEMVTGESSAALVPALNQLTSAPSQDVESAPSEIGRVAVSPPFVEQAAESTLEPNFPVQVNHDRTAVLGSPCPEPDTKDTSRELSQALLLPQKHTACERVVEPDGRCKLKSAAVLLAVVSVMASLFFVRVSYHVFLRQDQMAERALKGRLKINVTDFRDQPSHPFPTYSPSTTGVPNRGSRGPYTPRAKQPALYEDETSRTSQDDVTEDITESATDYVPESDTRNVATSSSQFPALSSRNSSVDVTKESVTKNVTERVIRKVIASSSSKTSALPFSKPSVYSGNDPLVYQISLTDTRNFIATNSSDFSALALNKSLVYSGNDTLVYQVNLTDWALNEQ